MEKKRARDIEQIKHGFSSNKKDAATEHNKPAMCQIWLLIHSELGKTSARTALAALNVAATEAAQIIESAAKSGSAICCLMPKECADTKMHEILKATESNDFSLLTHQIALSNS